MIDHFTIHYALDSRPYHVACCSSMFYKSTQTPCGVNCDACKATILYQEAADKENAIEQRLQDGLREFFRTHKRHNGGKGAEICRDGIEGTYTLRQAGSCDECAASYVGPSYRWLNRGVTLTNFAKKVIALVEGHAE